MGESGRGAVKQALLPCAVGFLPCSVGVLSCRVGEPTCVVKLLRARVECLCWGAGGGPFHNENTSVLIGPATAALPLYI